MSNQVKGKGGVRTPILSVHRRTLRPMMLILVNKNLPHNNPRKHHQTLHPPRIRTVQPAGPRPQALVHPNSVLHSRHPTSRPRQHRSPKFRKSSTPHPTNRPRSLGVKVKVFRRIGAGSMTGIANGVVNGNGNEIGIANGNGNVSGNVSGIAIGNATGSVTEIAIFCEAHRRSQPLRERQDDTRSRLRNK